MPTVALSWATGAVAKYIEGQPWYRTPGARIESTRLVAALPIPERDDARIAFVELSLDGGRHDLYVLAVANDANPLPVESPEALTDAMMRGPAIASAEGLTLQFHSVVSAADARGKLSTTTVIHAVEREESPVLEMLRFLGAAGFRHAPELSAWVEVRGQLGEEPIAATVAILSRSPPSHGTALEHLFDELHRWLDEIVLLGEIPPPKLAANDLLTRALFPLADDIVLAVGDYIRFAALLGARVGEMHKVLSKTHIDAFAPEMFDARARAETAERVQHDLAAAMDRLGPMPLVDLVRAKQASIERRLANAARAPEGGVRIRIHGDLHLERVLFTGTDFVIADFQGDRSRPIADRKAKRSPLVDVARMLRSIHYAAAAGLRARPIETQATLAPWVGLWQRAVAASFLGGWLRAVAESRVLPSAPAVTRALLDLFLLEQCVDEIRRPDNVEIALEGIRDVLETERKPGQMRTSMRFTPFVENVDPIAAAPSFVDPSSPDVRAFLEGTATHAHRRLGVHMRADGLADVVVWAPNAGQVAIVGDFNENASEGGLLAPVGDTGLFAGRVRDARAGQRYRFRIAGLDGGPAKDKADPFARASESSGASVLASSDYVWGDAAWMASRRVDQPLTILAVDLAGRGPYRKIAKSLAERAVGDGFTHVELLGLLGFFAPTDRYGSPEDLMFLVDTLHQAGLGVIFTWAPGSFALGEGGLACFAGTPTFESDDPVRAIHPGLGTGLFDFSRPAVRSFLLSSATFFIEQFHADGLRVEGLATILYRDFGRLPGAWSPNVEGGREDLDGVAFVRQLTSTLASTHPDVYLIADGSSASRDVTRDVAEGGLGFDLVWDAQLGDDLQFRLALDPRHHDELTTQLGSARGDVILVLDVADEHAAAAKLRLLHTVIWAERGQKLVFLDDELDARPDGLRQLLRDLNRLYRERPADVVIAVNLTTGETEERIAVPRSGRYRVVLDSNAAAYGGVAHPTSLVVDANASNELVVRLPPVAAIVFAHE